MAVFRVSGLPEAPLSNVVDKGLYAVQIAKMEFRLSQQKHTPEVHLDMVIMNGPVQDISGRIPVGKHIFGTFWIPDAGEGNVIGKARLKKLCIAAGVEPTEDLDTDQFIGKVIVIKVDHEKYNGEDRERVTDFRPLTDE